MRRIKAGSPAYTVLLEEARLSRRFGLPLPVLFELSRGAHLASHKVLVDRVEWLSQLLSADRARNRIQVLEPLHPDATAFKAAGLIHARVAPPHKRRQGTPAHQALAWYQDILIAATSWSTGFDLVTDDKDFSAMVAYLPGLSLLTSEAAGLDV